ncbi:MAG: aconitate hydratase [Promethearchaeota archaeon]
MSIAKRIIEDHLVEGELEPGSEISIKIDHTLTQDATGTMVYLQFESLDLDGVRTEKSVSFVDHNMIQADYKNPDDHRYLQSVAAKYGIYFSRPGNGICHQVFLERFACPGKTLLGSDSHTPTAGGVGSLAIGAGGLDVAVAMAGEPFHLKMPRILGIRLEGQLPRFVSAKDVILEILRQIDVSGGIGKVLEYFGPGVRSLSIPERATITNMGTETGATTSIFPSDDITKKFLIIQGRENEWKSIPAASDESDFDEIININLSNLEPLIARPHSPGSVVPVSELEGMGLDQVAIGSCTNSSLKDMITVASILKGKTVASNLSLAITPGSRQVLLNLAKIGALTELIKSGARILESACGPCIGMGFAPPTKGKTLRTFNRNFKGRAGTQDAEIYLASPEVAAVSAIAGKITDPRKLADVKIIDIPTNVEIDDGLIIPPRKERDRVEIIRGPNIKPIKLPKPMPESITIPVLLKVGDNITTDHIMPAGAEILPLRSNIPEISKHVFKFIDPTFSERAKSHHEGGAIVGGFNYGQGSSREHAAIAPMYLGIKTVIAKSFSRIHEANLINFGIIPFRFDDEKDLDQIKTGDVLKFPALKKYFKNGANGKYKILNETRNREILLNHDFSDWNIKVLMEGGLLNLVRKRIRQ